MATELELSELPDGLGLMVRFDGQRSVAELTSAVNTVCARAESGDEQTVVVLCFDAMSADCRQWPGEVDVQQVNRWERAVRRLERLPAVSIAMLQGTCGGPALDLLLAADFRIGTSDLRLLLPVNDEHFWPGMSVYRLVRHLGVARARQIVLWGTDIPLDKALDLGLIDHVDDDVAEAVRTATVLTGRLSGREMAVRRQLLLEAASAEYDDAVGTHLAACDRELRRLRGSAGQLPLAATERSGS
ncbi:enoyl-CoA hydratase-related protein [Streptomyces sp. RB6PN25]|uniref:Enoyl-CoA hydratase-related protein n=1 Tax=Streptomyces humicola TaxID=2953240 RepID=A0ABT1Q0P6_9ACTN|nr:enoyl-CoA-hydratase DpgB [Streptomyces humicola]MCQ4083506.1 enoyl-CoA hydratase-related protein [Streptomyces humicola]